MHIHDDHMYHGAGLIQIAEHPTFKAINALNVGGKKSEVAYRINDNIAAYFKYCNEPKSRFNEYRFGFTTEHLEELDRIAEANERTFVVLVCVRAREICCISYQQLQDLVTARREAKGEDESTYVVCVTAQQGKSLRAYVNVPGKRGKFEKQLVIARNAFPGVIFEE
ncbi:MAG: hypothetical protein HS108_04890 [Planctomycetes bacterium]|nr:hypothetical protein [Planctomycetota bacterium]MCZ7608075.1 hypothetical protein [Planctomycetota bacterium]